MATKILLVEGKRADHPSFSSGLTKKGYQIDSVPNGTAALLKLMEVDPDLVVIDASSLRTSGKRICQSIRKELDGVPIILMMDKTQEPVDKVEADVVLTLPFTVQKLINRFRPLLPPEEKDLLHVGPIRLNLQHKQVRCLGRQVRLTPRQVALLRLLMEHHGEVMERDALFKLVWETQYTEDTRTLDVHISWLRHAIEADPRHPRFLKTVRGVGYRLDI